MTEELRSVSIVDPGRWSASLIVVIALLAVGVCLLRLSSRCRRSATFLGRIASGVASLLGVATTVLGWIACGGWISYSTTAVFGWSPQVGGWLTLLVVLGPPLAYTVVTVIAPDTIQFARFVRRQAPFLLRPSAAPPRLVVHPPTGPDGRRLYDRWTLATRVQGVAVACGAMLLAVSWKLTDSSGAVVFLAVLVLAVAAVVAYGPAMWLAHVVRWPAVRVGSGSTEEQEAAIIDAGHGVGLLLIATVIGGWAAKYLSDHLLTTPLLAGISFPIGAALAAVLVQGTQFPFEMKRPDPPAAESNTPS